MKRTGREGKRILVWMRRAYRTQDHVPLWNAVHEADEVIPLVCLSPDIIPSSSDLRHAALRDAILDLDTSLRKLGGRLFGALGDAVDVIPSIARAAHVDAVYAARVYDPHSRKRDERLGAALAAFGIQWREFKDTVIFEEREILTGAGEPYKIYTPYRNAWEMRSDRVPPVLPALRKVSVPESVPGTLAVHAVSGFDRPRQIGGLSPVQKLDRFLEQRVARYHQTRDLPGEEGTSRLSSDLALGRISVRHVYWSARSTMEGTVGRSREGIRSFIGELLWREFYYQVLANCPRVAAGPFKTGFAEMPWSDNGGHFEAWVSGRTGYPFVDAAMRQLAQQGWMHNRARMVVASFLTKDLHIDWRRGERVFLDRLTDADVASNNGGWQWTAGTGTDAAPYFRIFNPVAQGERFDPEGRYVKTYLPELKNVPVPFVHQPWRLDRAEQRVAGVAIGESYPAPIVEHAHERRVALEMYDRLRSRTTLSDTVPA